MEVTTLIENTKNKANDNLHNEHGLSIFINSNNKKILFDTGATGKAIDNSKALEIDIEDIDIAVISHGHGDHGGGLLSFLEKNKEARVYIKSGANKEFFFKFLMLKMDVSIGKEVFERFADRISFVKDFTKIDEDIYIITDIKHNYPTPKGNNHLLVKDGEQIKQDDFNHELILVVKEEDGLNIFTACSHNGICNMIESVKGIFNGEKIKSVFGGFHLIGLPILNTMSESKEKVQNIAKQILGYNLGGVYTGHCTGEKAYKELKKVLGDKLNYISTGTKVSI